MSLSERQRMLRLQEHAREEDEKILDIFNCVERLHDADLRKAVITERGEWVLSKIPRQNRPPGKANFQRLAKALPRHIMGCLLARQPAVPPDSTTAVLTDCQIASTSCYNHVAKALQLLCALCGSAAQHRGLRAELLLSAEFGTEVVDAANLILVAMAGPEAERFLAAAASPQSMQEAIDRASLVPGALRALAYAFTARAEEPGDALQLSWDSIAEGLLCHPRGAVLLDAAFDAVRTLVLAVRAALLAADTSSEDVYRLAFHAGGAMELLSYLCTTPLFYHRLMVHDPSGAAPLRLVLACLTLHDAPLAAPPYCRLPQHRGQTVGGAHPAQPLSLTAAVLPAAPSMPPIPAAPTGPLASFAAAPPPYSTSKGHGSAELLAARGFALVVILAEFEEPSYMDQLFEHADVTQLAHQVLERAAAYIAQVLLRPSTSRHPPAVGEPQMAINVLRAAEVLCDDSNFKAGLVALLTREVAELLTVDVQVFKSRWCAGEEAVAYHSKDEILVNSISSYALEGVEQLGRASRKLFGSAGAGRQAQKGRVGQLLALERAVLLYKLVGNLHCQSQDSQSQDSSESFPVRLIAALRAVSPVAVSQALHNLRQLQQLLVPFGPPHASEDVELLTEEDINLVSEVIDHLERGQQLGQQRPVAAPAAFAVAGIAGVAPMQPT